MEETSDASCRKIKIIVVGDSECGKTALLNAFARNRFLEDYDPTVFNNLTTEVEVDGERIELSLWDTSGQSEYDHIRPLSYAEADVAIICFDISKPETTDNIADKWVKELSPVTSNDKPVLLIGCKQDLRTDPAVVSELAKSRRLPVSHQQGTDLARQINAVTYVECSAKSMDTQLEDVFEKTTRAAMGKPINCISELKRKKKTNKPRQSKCHGCSIV